MFTRSLSRRAFLQACAAITATLALPPAYVARVAAAVDRAPRLPVIWLRGLGCGGDTQAFLRAAEPTTAQLLLDLLSIEAHDTLAAAPPTTGALEALAATLRADHGGYLLFLEGALPTAGDGEAMTLGGRSLREVATGLAGGAIATIALGTCAADGGIAAAAGGATGATGVATAGPQRLVSLPGCPVNVANLAATVVHYLTFRELPPTDGRGRPLFAYGALIHNECGRRPHFEFGEFVQDWGDEGAQKGWCLYRMGCKGPETFGPCASVRYAQGTSWPVKAGAPCIGCHTPGFWDANTPFTGRLPPPAALFPDITVDQVGQAAVAAVGLAVVAHGSASIVRAKRNQRLAANAVANGVTPTPGAPTPAAQPAPDPAIGATDPGGPDLDQVPTAQDQPVGLGPDPDQAGLTSREPATTTDPVGPEPAPAGPDRDAPLVDRT